MDIEHPFVLVKTPSGLRIIKLVESEDKIDNPLFRWTREQLDLSYERVGYNNPNINYQFPYYELKKNG